MSAEFLRKLIAQSASLPKLGESLVLLKFCIPLLQVNLLWLVWGHTLKP